MIHKNISIIVAIAENFAIGKNNDLLFHLPYRYEDRTRIHPIGGLYPGARVQVEGEIEHAAIVRGRRAMLVAPAAASPAGTTGAASGWVATVVAGSTGVNSSGGKRTNQMTSTSELSTMARRRFLF